MEKKRYECAESGDDEDEELGNAHVRTPSSRSKSYRPVSKLGVEMMRTNSRGSVVSGSEELLRKEREALERSKNGESDDAIESGEEPTSSSPSTGVEDRFDKLQISANTIAERPEEEISPRHSPLPQGTDLGLTPSAATRPKRPSRSQQDRGITEIYRGTTSQPSAATKASTETLKKGQVTPPIIVSKEDEPGASAMILNTPSPRISKGYLGTDADNDYDQTADSEATPRPQHTPSPHLDLDHTPRPSER
jgi:serine/threonine-protein kinase RIM15